MCKTIVYFNGSAFTEHYLFNILTGEPYKVTEDLFFAVVGYDRKLIPMHYDKDNINRQNFYLDGVLLGYRER